MSNNWPDNILMIDSFEYVDTIGLTSEELNARARTVAEERACASGYSLVTVSVDYMLNRVYYPETPNSYQVKVYGHYLKSSGTKEALAQAESLAAQDKSKEELLSLLKSARDLIKEALAESEKLDKNGCDCLSQKLERDMNKLLFDVLAKYPELRNE